MQNTRTFKITDAAGVLAHRVVVQGTNAGECKKPAAAGEGKIVGVTRQAQATQNASVPVDQPGGEPVLLVAAGAIAVGDMLDIADNTGKVRSCQATVAAGLANPAAVVYLVGVAESAAAADGDQIWGRLSFQVIPLALS